MSVAVAEETANKQNSINYGDLPQRVRWLLKEVFLTAQSTSEPILDSTFPPVQRLNVTLRRHGVVRGSMSGVGTTLSEQLTSAVQRVAKDGRFGGSIVEGDLNDLSIEVWVQVESTSLSLEARKLDGAQEIGSVGVEVRRGKKSAYFKPSVALTKRFLTQPEMLKHVCKKAGMPLDAWKEPKTEVLLTKWLCYALPADSTKSFPVYRLRTSHQTTLSRKTVDEWGRASAMYLVRNQEASGEITYLFDPITGKALHESSNSVRVSGCFFALTSALTHYMDTSIQSELERASILLYRNIASRGQLWQPGCRIIHDSLQQHGPPKLGTTALFACGLMMRPFAKLLKEERQQLLNTLKAVQNSEGRFASHIGSASISRRSENYFSGQALLALALATNEGDDEALEACRRAFAPYKAIFEQNPTSAFVGWQIDVWARLAKITSKEEYADFAFQQADWLCELLLTTSACDEWIGGFSRSGSEPTASSVVFVEALCCALSLAEMLGDAARINRYTLAIRFSLQFCQRLRAESILELYRAFPERSEGGIVMSMRDLSIRCDFVQHFITMCLQLKEVAHLVCDAAM